MTTELKNRRLILTDNLKSEKAKQQKQVDGSKAEKFKSMVVP